MKGWVGGISEMGKERGREGGGERGRERLTN